MVPKQSDAPPCLICGNEDAGWCTKCHSASYCKKDKSCQLIDWSSHKLLCAKYRSETVVPPPSPQHSLCLFIPEVGPLELLWLPRDASNDEDNIEPYFGKFASSAATLVGDVFDIQHFVFNYTRWRRCDRPFMIYVRNKFVTDGSKDNYNILRMLPHLDFPPYWKGPMLVCMDYDENDFSMRTYRDLIDILTYMVLEFEDKGSRAPVMVRGLKVACDEERVGYKSAGYLPVELLEGDSIFESQDLQSPVSVCAGIPMGVRKISNHSKTNTPIANLFLNKRGKGDGGKDEKWISSRKEAGNVIVARQDKLPLDEKLFQAVCDWSEQLVPTKIMSMNGDQTADAQTEAGTTHQEFQDFMRERNQ